MQATTIGQALRGLLVSALAGLMTLCLAVLLSYLLVRIGVYINQAMDLRMKPVAMVLMVLAILSAVMLMFYLAMIMSMFVLRPFISRAELRIHFIEKLGAGRFPGPFHHWLFERIFRR